MGGCIWTNSSHWWMRTNRQRSVITLQVLAIEFVLWAIDFVPLANEFVLLANEFVPLAIEFVTLAFEFVALVALARKFIRNKIGSWSEHENKI